MKKYMFILALSATLGAAAQDAQFSDPGPELQSAEEIAALLEIDVAQAQKVADTQAAFAEKMDAWRAQQREQIKQRRAEGPDLGEAKIEANHRAMLQAQRERVDLEEAHYDALLALLPASKVERLLRDTRKQRMEGRPAPMGERRAAPRR